MKKNTIFHLEKKSLKRRLGIFDLFAVGYGDLSSSIYYALGVTALFALGATPLALLLAGFVFICTAITYAEMTSMFPEAGGSASFARQAFNDLISFIAGWGLLLDYIVTIAISAFAIPGYLASFLHVFNWNILDVLGSQMIAAFLFILILLALNIRGIREATLPSIILSVITIVTQIVIIAMAFIFIFNINDLIHYLRIGGTDTAISPTWPQFWRGTAMAMVAYTGIESIAQLSAEAKNPSRILPKSIKLTMWTLVILYVGIAMIAFSAITPHELGTTYIQNPIEGIVVNFPFGAKILTPWVGLVAAIILFVASNSGLIGASRLSYFMGQHYQIPRTFYTLHQKYRTPYVALISFAVLAILIILISRGHLLFLADLYNFGAMIAFFFAHLSLIVLRIKKPELHRPYRSPFNIPFGKAKIPLTAIIGLLASFSVWVLIIVTKPAGRYVGLSWLIIGTGMYLLYRRRKKIAALGQLKLEGVKFSYKPFVFEKVLVVAKGGGAETQAVQIACEMAKLHKAKVYAVHVLEVPLALPFDVALPHRVKLGEDALKRAEAIARENNVAIELQMIRSRSIKKALIDVIKGIKPDLFVLEAEKNQPNRKLSKSLEKTLKKHTCRFWFCGH